MLRKSVDRLSVPAGAPVWVTRDMIVATVETWQPYYPEEITEEVALEIILTFARAAEGWRWS